MVSGGANRADQMDEHTHPLLTLILVRLAPIPLGVKNYGLALVRARTPPRPLPRPAACLCCSWAGECAGRK